MADLPQDELRDLLAAVGFEVPELAAPVVFDAAVRTFQARLGLVCDGVVGPLTTATLHNAASNPGSGPREDPLLALLNVPYFSQRDNVYAPNGTCNVTCLAMVLAHLGLAQADAAGGQLEDRLFARLQQPDAQAHFHKRFAWAAQNYNPRNVHGMLAWLAAQYGAHDRFVRDASWGAVWTELDADRPVITTGAFTGSGHIVCIVGRTAVDHPVIHDPWGNYNTGYADRDGAFVIYPTIREVVTGGPEQLWAHFIQPATP